jgi:uncharacterized iron-regulated membrane protein
MRVRTTLVRVHLWVGLVVAPVLLILGVTGALLVVEEPIADRLDAKTALVQPGMTRRSADEMVASVRRAYPGAQLGLQLAQDPDHPVALTVNLPAEKRVETVLVDPYTARVLGTHGDQQLFFRKVRDLHRRLLFGQWGNVVILWTTVGLVLLSITGPIVWWPRRRVGVRWRNRGWRDLLDLHAVLGIVSSAFLLLFAVTGAVVHWDQAVQQSLGTLTGHASPREPRNLAVSGCEDSGMLGPDGLVAAGAAVLPGARPTHLMLPDDPSSPARMSLKFPEDRTPNGRSILLLDPCTGRSVFTISTRSAPVSYLYPREWNRELHTGDIFGWPSRVLAFLSSLTLAAMAVTGPAVWLMRRRRV